MPGDRDQAKSILDSKEGERRGVIRGVQDARGDGDAYASLSVYLRQPRTWICT
jgi:hypothetical protein